MELNNPLYKNQGIHVICSIFTVEKGITKVLLIRRKNEPYKDMWALVGGALYNNEEPLEGMRREIFEKSGIRDIDIHFSEFFGRIDRSPLMRMLALTFVGLIDFETTNILKNTLKTSDADWFPIDDIPPLAYDHNEILSEAINTLKDKILSSDILNTLFPNGFSIPEIQKTCESILKVEFDRRNFRKKLLSLNLVEDTKKTKTFEGTKPANIYRFKKGQSNKRVF